jgi:hypothetical protein
MMKYGRQSRFRIVQDTPRGNLAVLATAASLAAITHDADQLRPPFRIEQLDLGEYTVEEYFKHTPMHPRWIKVYARSAPRRGTLPNPAAGAAIHNPATGQLRPVDMITDRAKRYRAQAHVEGNREHCIYCGAADPRDIDHINGREADGNPANLAPACRSCNTAKGAHFARLHMGTKTAQYNPTAGATTVSQWTAAVMSIIPHDGKKRRPWETPLSGAGPMPTAEAVQLIRDTPPGRRSKFAAQLNALRSRRRAAGDSVPF